MSLDEAERVCQEAEDIENFPRIELRGAHELSKGGIQMVYAVGHGKIEHGGRNKGVLFYFPALITDSSYGKEHIKNCRRVKNIFAYRIEEIRELEQSGEVYSRE